MLKTIGGYLCIWLAYILTFVLLLCVVTITAIYLGRIARSSENVRNVSKILDDEGLSGLPQIVVNDQEQPTTNIVAIIQQLNFIVNNTKDTTDVIEKEPKQE